MKFNFLKKSEMVTSDDYGSAGYERNTENFRKECVIEG